MAEELLLINDNGIIELGNIFPKGFLMPLPVMGDKPWMIVIGGPNGAGKTTAAMAVLPKALHLLEFLNADEIAKGLSPFNPTSVRIQASRLMLERANYLIKNKISFGIESTLAAKTLNKLIEEAKSKGYNVLLLYFWLSSSELALSRVKQRVEAGGHNIPEEDVHRRYTRSIQNLAKLYLPLADVWMLFDNSEEEPILVAEGEHEESVRSVYDEKIWQTLMQGANS